MSWWHFPSGSLDVCENLKRKFVMKMCTTFVRNCYQKSSNVKNYYKILFARVAYKVNLSSDYLRFGVESRRFRKFKLLQTNLALRSHSVWPWVIWDRFNYKRQSWRETCARSALDAVNIASPSWLISIRRYWPAVSALFVTPSSSKNIL